MIRVEENDIRPNFSGLVVLARGYLYSLFGKVSETVPITLPDTSFQRVNVTLRTSGAVRGSMSGRGKSLKEQLQDAVSRAARDSRFAGSIVRADLQNVTVEVWLQVSSEPIPVERRQSEDVIQLGLDGVEVEQQSASAYYKPSVALTSHLKSQCDLFSALCKKAKLPVDAWKSPDCVLRRTSWIHLCETPSRKVVKLSALRSSFHLDITVESMTAWVRNNANYLVENQHSDGSFCYQYRPFSNSAKRGDANPVRGSGCAYAIAEAASSEYLASEREVGECADRAVAAILRRAVSLESGGIYIADSLKQMTGGKLGTTALLLLALLTPRLRGRFEQEVEALARGIKFAQSNDGIFECAFGDGQKTDSHINFFPGQAILALVVKAQLGDESCQDAYRRAFVPYRDHFRRCPATAFVGWQADVWCRAALLDENPEYAEFVFEQLDWILQFQLLADRRQLESGGFSWNGKRPNYSSIVYTEAIARGAELAHRLGDRRWLRYRDAYRVGIDFCSRLRLTREQSAFFSHPSRAIGGMATSIADLGVRSDVVQHAITLALATLERPVLLER